LEDIFGYPAEFDTTKIKIFLAGLKPMYDRCLQNTVFAENEVLF
jgi:hypothetical protein